MKYRRMNNDILEICDKDNNVIMSISEKFEDGVLTIKVSGQIRNEVAHDFEDEVMAGLSVCKNVILDFSGVNYIASVALNSLLSAQNIVDDNENAYMKIVNVGSDVMEVFEQSGFSDILMIENE